MHGENKLRSTGIICSGGHLISKWIRLARKILQDAEDMEREVGGGIGMGNTCKPMAVSFQCMTKFTTNKKNK